MATSIAGSPQMTDHKHRAAALQLSSRLKSCWELDIDWNSLPCGLSEVHSTCTYVLGGSVWGSNYHALDTIGKCIFLQGCRQIGEAISLPATAVLAGIIMIVGFSMSHSVVEVEGTDWVEPVLVWMAFCMPTGMGKSSLCKFLRKLIGEARRQCGLDGSTSSWLMDDQSFEKMGDLMEKNHWKLLGLYDELSVFLSQVNIFRGRGLSDSHELAVFLQLYGADPWVRRTGEFICVVSYDTLSCYNYNVHAWYQILFSLAVSGEANFSMGHTGLTIGGFIQPSIARHLIEIQSNVEKGLCQRFLWIVPKPTVVSFERLQRVNKEFATSLGEFMCVLTCKLENLPSSYN